MTTFNYWTRNVQIKRTISGPTTGKSSRLTEEGDKKNIWRHFFSFLPQILSCFLKPTVPSDSSKPSVQTTASTVRSQKLFYIFSARSISAHTKTILKSAHSFRLSPAMRKACLRVAYLSCQHFLSATQLTGCLKNVKHQRLISNIVNSGHQTVGRVTYYSFTNLKLSF
jgi:hypothetical protein